MSAAPGRSERVLTPVAARLPRMTRDEATGTTRLLALLAREGIMAAALADTDGTDQSGLPRLSFDSDHGPLGLLPMGDGTRLPTLQRGDGTPDLAGAAAALSEAEPTIVALERALHTPLRLRGIDASPAQPSVLVDLLTPLGGAARLDAPATVLARLPRPTWDTQPAAARGLAARCRVVLGTCGLDEAAAARLQAGDVLLTAGLVSRTPAVLVIGHGSLSAPARLDPRARTLLFTSASSPAMSDSPLPSPPARGDWAHLPVQLRFELPGVDVPFGTLAGMQTGAVVPLAADGPLLRVTIVNGGRQVGQGELVAIGDGFGVRLTGPLASAA